MKKLICQAFCSDLSVNEMANGYAISTPYEDVYGDPLGFYAVRGQDGTFRMIDNGSTVAFLEAAGATLDSKTRLEALTKLLAEYRAEYDEERGELSVAHLRETDLPRASLNFMALLLRIRDLLFLTRENVENTFREDVINALTERLQGKATIRYQEPVAPGMADTIPDMVLEAPDHDPVAVFIATSDQRVNDAIYLRMVADHEALVPLTVIAMLEDDTSIARHLKQRADNRLDAVPRYRKDERAALDRVVREVMGRGTSSIH